MTSRRSKFQEDTYLRILRILQDSPDLRRRDIEQFLGGSTSGLNYCLSTLIDKGWVEVHNFSESKNKFGLLAHPDRHCKEDSACGPVYAQKAFVI